MAISLGTTPDLTAEQPSTVPPGVVGASVGILIYSFVCLASTILLSGVIYTSRERWNYVFFMAVFVSISSIVSIIQQIYYPLNWADIRTTQWTRAQESIDVPAIGYGPLSEGTDLILFWIQFYCYSVNSLFILFWSMALVKGVHNMRFKSISDETATWLSISSKVFAIALPGLLLGIAQGVEPVYRNVPANLILTNGPILSCLSIGSICVIAILFKYLNSRALFASLQNSHSQGTSGLSGSQGHTRPQMNRIRIDKWVIFRFSAAFVILSIFMICIVVFEAVRYTGSQALALAPAPDYSTGSSVNDVLQFIPGVTAGLMAFLLFGTTAQYRARYAAWFRKIRCMGGRNSRPSLDGGNNRATIGSKQQRRSRNAWDALPDHLSAPSYQCTIEAGSPDDSLEMAMQPMRQHQRKGSKMGAVNVSEEVTVDDSGRMSALDFGLDDRNGRRPLDGQRWN